MKKSMFVGALAMVALIAAGATAADTKTAAHKASTAKSLTGCLEKGDEANTYKLTHVEGGGNWELLGAPASLKMADHVGHKVEVSGTAMSASSAMKMEHAGEKAKGTAMKEENEEHHLKVTALKHVAPTCP